MNKEDLKNDFLAAAQNYNDKVVEFVRGFIFEIKRREELSNTAIADLLNVEENALEEFLNEKWTGNISSSMLTKLALLGLPINMMMTNSLPIETQTSEWLINLDKYVDCFKPKLNTTEKGLSAEDNTEVCVDYLTKSVMRLMNQLGLKTAEDIDMLCDILEQSDQFLKEEVKPKKHRKHRHDKKHKEQI